LNPVICTVSNRPRNTHTHAKAIVHWRISSGSTYVVIRKRFGSAVRNDWDHKAKAISTELNFQMKGVTIDGDYDEGWRIWSWTLILLQKPMLWLHGINRLVKSVSLKIQYLLISVKFNSCCFDRIVVNPFILT
jgi:hypothetical protein